MVKAMYVMKIIMKEIRRRKARWAASMARIIVSMV